METWGVSTDRRGFSNTAVQGRDGEGEACDFYRVNGREPEPIWNQDNTTTTLSWTVVLMGDVGVGLRLIFHQ